MVSSSARAWAVVGGLAALLVCPPASRAAEWSTVKGKVVWAGGAVPKPKKLTVDKDKPACKGGNLNSDALVVNPKNKGVRYVLVWLTSEKDPKKPLTPVNPDLVKVPKKVVTIDQPCCMFEPHMIAIRGGQSVVFKNTAGIAHSVDMRGSDLGPTFNKTLPPGGKLEVNNVPGRALSDPIPIQIACGSHGWMKGWVAAFPTPYFAMTDADGNFEIKGVPTGKCRMLMWHEEAGWVLDGKSPKRRGGKVIDVSGDATDVGTINLNIAKDD